jgi:hypothetical protein
MKLKITFLLMMAIAFYQSKAQFALEQTYNHSLSITKINENEYKYFLMDVAKSECRIFNLDHSPWKTIPITLPKDYYLYDIKFVTQNLFNSDSDIELWYSAYKWVGTTADGYYQYQSKVINENGATLANIENGMYAYLIKAGDNSYKLSVYAYDNSFWPGSVQTHIFSIPGTATAAENTKSALLDPYPNPAENAINLPLFDEQQTGTLQVFSLSGQLMLKTEISNQALYQLNTLGWKPGFYTYRVITNAGASESKKFMVK